MFENINWEEIYVVLGVACVVIGLALKVMIYAKKEVEELDRLDSLEN